MGLKEINFGGILVIAGKVWLGLIAGLMVWSYLRMLYIEGVWKLLEDPSFHVWSALATLLINGPAIMLPGVALIGLGKMLGDKY